jgi:hypothetical protein
VKFKERGRMNLVSANQANPVTALTISHVRTTTSFHSTQISEGIFVLHTAK